MKEEDISAAWERQVDELIQAAREERCPELAYQWVSDAYDRLSPEERPIVDAVLAEWLESSNGDRRLGARFLIHEKRITSALPALRRRAQALATLRTPWAPDELERVQRIIEDLTRPAPPEEAAEEAPVELPQVGALPKGYTPHGLARVTGREGQGVLPSMVLEALREKEPVMMPGGTLVYESHKVGRIVLSQEGQLVTAIVLPKPLPRGKAVMDRGKVERLGAKLIRGKIAEVRLDGEELGLLYLQVSTKAPGFYCLLEKLRSSPSGLTDGEKELCSKLAYWVLPLPEDDAEVQELFRGVENEVTRILNRRLAKGGSPEEADPLARWARFRACGFRENLTSLRSRMQTACALSEEQAAFLCGLVEETAPSALPLLERVAHGVATAFELRALVHIAGWEIGYGFDAQGEPNKYGLFVEELADALSRILELLERWGASQREEP
jgi:hypothetical protein